MCRGGRSRGLRRIRIGIANTFRIAIAREAAILVRVFIIIRWLVLEEKKSVGWGTYVGASFEEINSTSSGESSRSLKPCWGVVCVKGMLRAAWVDIFNVGIFMRERVEFWSGDERIDIDAVTRRWIGMHGPLLIYGQI